MGEVQNREVFVVEDAHGDAVRVLEWGDWTPTDQTIGCLEFVGGEDGDERTVHLRPESARRLGEKLIEFAKSRGA